jgi:uncharacterized protein
MVRGFIYDGPTIAPVDYDEAFCPWCIADGSISEKLAVKFFDFSFGAPTDVPEAILKTISQNTPGYFTWQEPKWLFHCGDGAAFLGPMGYEEVREYTGAIESLKDECVAFGWKLDEVHDYIQSLSRDAGPTAYVFECLECGRHLAYSDFA